MVVPRVLAYGNVRILKSGEEESEEGENTKIVGQRAESEEARLVLIPIILSVNNRTHSPVNTRRSLMKKKRSQNYTFVQCLFRSKSLSMRSLYLILLL